MYISQLLKSTSVRESRKISILKNFDILARITKIEISMVMGYGSSTDVVRFQSVCARGQNLFTPENHDKFKRSLPVRGLSGV